MNASYGGIAEGKSDAILDAVLSLATSGSAGKIGEAARR
jgi:hypothetical protein